MPTAEPPESLKVTSSQLRSFNKTRRETGYRSRTEVKIAEEMLKLSDKVHYEEVCLPYSYIVNRHYTPDFTVPEKAMMIEVKGRFLPEDRSKMLLVRQNYPNLDIRLVFDNPNAKLSRNSSTTYAQWAEKIGFKWCSTKDFPPPEWKRHKPNKAQVKAYESATARASAGRVSLPKA